MNPLVKKKQQVTRLAQSGQLKEARNLGMALSRTASQDPEVWFLLGAIHGELSEYPEAERCCRKALALAPGHLMLNYNFALVLMKQHKLQEAVAALKSCITINPRFTDGYREIGNALALSGDPEAAIGAYEKAIELAPDSASTLYNLGNTLCNLGRSDEAMDAYTHAIRLEPNSPDAYAGLTAILQSQFKFDRILEILEPVYARLEKSPEINYRLAVAYQEQGDSIAALKYYRATLDLDSSHIDAQVGAACIKGLQGDYQAAGQELALLLEKNPDNTGIQIAHARFAGKTCETDVTIERLNAAIEKGVPSDRALSQLHFAVADLYDAQDRFEEAFSHYQAANRLRHADFDYASHRWMFDALKAAYSAENLLKLPRSGNLSDTPVFIVGMPRSGTSLVEQVLASHPQVFGAGELVYINRAVDRLATTADPDNPYPGCITGIDSSALERIADAYLSEVHTRCGDAARVTDKMPSNFMHLGFIELLFPRARIIHCVRDPRDACLSCFFQQFSGEHPYAYDLSDLGHYYLLYEQLMQHWKQVSGLRMHEVSYEGLVTNQETETRKLLEFCGLEWNDACLQFHRTRRMVSTASHDQVRKPLYTRSVGRWHNYAQHLGALTAALCDRKGT